MTYHTSPKLNDWQKQIIYGTVLGGSSIIKQKNGRNCYLSMRGNKKEWLQYKAYQLNCIASQTPYHTKDGYIRWHSASSPVFNQFYNIFYKEGKRKIEMETLDTLRDIGFAVWFFDAGGIEGNRITLNTRIYGNYTEVISRYFNEIGLENQYNSKINFSEKASEQFLAIISDYVPKLK